MHSESIRHALFSQDLFQDNLALIPVSLKYRNILILKGHSHKDFADFWSKLC